MKAKYFIISFILLAIIFAACNQSTKTIDETPTRGKIKISVDDSYRLLIDGELATFHALYKYASIKPMYKTEYDVIEDFMNDTVKCIVTSLKLSKEQEEYLISNKVIPKTTLIAYDAIALIINKENTDTLLRFTKLADLFTGRINKWEQLNKANKSGEIKLVFDHNKSSNARYIREKYNLKEFPGNFLSAQSNEEVVNYVETHKNAIGIISVNWISDKDDTVSNSFLKKIRPLAISSEIDPEGEYFYKPYAAFIADKSYPLRRDIYMISRESFSGLGSGFISFVAGEKGQRIILKSGMVPATMPVRLIQLKNENL